MIRKSFVVVIEEDHWPNISCSIMHLDLDEWMIAQLIAKNRGASSRESLYDTAQTNFEVHVRNALGQSMRELFNDRKAAPETRAREPLDIPERNSVPETGAAVPPEEGAHRGRDAGEMEKPRRVQEGVARQTKTSTRKKGGR